MVNAQCGFIKFGSAQQLNKWGAELRQFFWKLLGVKINVLAPLFLLLTCSHNFALP